MFDPTSATRPRLVLALSSIGHFVNDGTTFFVPVLAALLGPLRGFSPVEVTVLFGVYYVTASVLGLFIGWWSDRNGRTTQLMAFGIFLLGVGLAGFYVVLSGLAGSAAFPVALLAGGITGFATSFYHPLGASLLQRAFRAESRGTALGINGAFGSVGRASYPLLFFVATLAFTTVHSILLFVAVGFASAFLILALVRPGHGVEPERDRSRPPPRANEATTGGIVRLTGVAFVRSVATLGVAVWIPTYLTSVRNVPASGSLGLAVAVMYIGGILGQPIFGVAADRVDRRLLIGTSSAGAALSTFAYLATTGLASYALLFSIGFFTFSAFPLLMTLSAEYVPSGSSTLANALVFGLGSGGGGVVGPLVVGAFAAGGYGGLVSGLEAMAAVGLVAALLVLLLPRGGTGSPRSLFG